MIDLFRRRQSLIFACIISLICSIVCIFVAIEYSILLFFLFMFGIYIILINEYKLYKNTINKFYDLKRKLHYKQVNIMQAEVLMNILNGELKNFSYLDTMMLENKLYKVSNKLNYLIKKDININNRLAKISKIKQLIVDMEKIIDEIDSLIYDINYIYGQAKKKSGYKEKQSDYKYNQFSDQFKILGLNINSTEKDIKKQYRMLAKKYHPDVDPRYEEKFKKITEAYNILMTKTGR